MPRARHRRRIGDVGQEGFGARIAVEDIGLGAFLIVQHALDGDARAARPCGVRRGAAIAGEIAGVTILGQMNCLSNVAG